MGCWDGDYDDDDDEDLEEFLERRDHEVKESLRAMTPEDLAKQWQRECNRHDSAVDRCEALNSPTIEDAAGWMEFIESVFKEKGWDFHKHVSIAEDGE